MLVMYASCLGLHIEVDSDGLLGTNLYDKRMHSISSIVNLSYEATFKQHLHLEYIIFLYLLAETMFRIYGAYYDFLTRKLLQQSCD